MQFHLQIADHFDTLANGKVLALGLFADRVVVMRVPAEAPEPTAELPYAVDLGLLLTITDAPPTPLQGEVRIVPPGGGAPIRVLPISGLSIGAGRSANILAQLKPLLVPQAGVFTVEAHVGDEVLGASFEVRIIRLASTAPSDVEVAPNAEAPPQPPSAPSAPKRRRPSKPKS